MKIFFGDLVHNWSGSGIWTIPLNIGYIASYAQKKAKETNVDITTRLFKDPTNIIEAIKSEKPDVIALSYYVWNENLNSKIMTLAKEVNPNVLNVGGGPHFTNINANLQGAEVFFKNISPECDIYVVNQGEKGFWDVIERFKDVNNDVEKLRKEKIGGTIINLLPRNNDSNLSTEERFYVGENIGALDDLNEIPSPYLNGMLDEWFEGPYIPVIETNRSCPYRCTFCAWGIGTVKLSKFDEERVKEEIEYISKRTKNASQIFIGDANFAILERDADFAKEMYKCSTKYNFPLHVIVFWNKTRPDRVLNTAKEFRGLATVGASMQSLNEDVLSAVKRKNLTIEQINQLLSDLNDLGIYESPFTELIIGLPHETKESHIEANRELMDLGFSVTNYNLHLLPGTEMDSEDSRKNFFKKTGYRLFDNAFGIYDNEYIFEAQETVLTTNKLGIEDFRYFRFFHFLQQMMWEKKWHRDYLEFLRTYGISPVDLFDKIISEIKKESKNKISKMYEEFMEIYHEAETFDTPDELYEFWSREHNFKMLEDGKYGKLNMLYTFKVVLELKKEFTEFLYKINEKLKKDLGFDESFLSAANAILDFQNLTFVQIDEDHNLNTKFTKTFNYDILSWINNDFSNLKIQKEKKTYTFTISKKQEKMLTTQLRQYKASSLNSTLQKMNTYEDRECLFYNVDYA